MDEAGMTHIKGIIESILFVSEKPVTVNQLRDVIEGMDSNEIKKGIMALQEEYAQRKSGIVIMEIAGGYQMMTNPTYAMYLRKFYSHRHKERLSKPALETLAIVAYKQPVSRQDIELIRGVNSDGVVNHLVNKGLIKIIGRKDVPGRPYIYGTTKQFLEYFGLRSLSDLPKLEDFSSLEPMEELEEKALSEEQEKSQENQENKTTEEGDSSQTDEITLK